jgi:hypothetical protein
MCRRSYFTTPDLAHTQGTRDLPYDARRIMILFSGLFFSLQQKFQVLEDGQKVIVASVKSYDNMLKNLELVATDAYRVC